MTTPVPQAFRDQRQFGLISGHLEAVWPCAKTSQPMFSCFLRSCLPSMNLLEALPILVRVAGLPRQSFLSIDVEQDSK